MWFMKGVNIRGQSAGLGKGSAGGRLLFQVGEILPTHSIEGGEIEINKFVFRASGV